MFRAFENLVDPFAPAHQAPPRANLRAYLAQQLGPYRKWLPLMFATGVLTALMESGLIFYSGRVVDLMAETGAGAFWDAHGTEMLLALFCVLVVRPSLVGLNHLLLEQTLSSNLQEQVRWQAHRHLLGQSAGFFQNDFAGRLSNRVMQMGPAVQDSVHMLFEAVLFAVTYMIGAVVVLSQIDWRLAVPLVAWVGLYGLYVRHTALNVAATAEKWSDARSAATGRIVDAYGNIETVKLFARDGQEQAYALSALRRLRTRYQRFLRMMTRLAFGSIAINGVLILIVVAPAIWLWMRGSVSVGEVAAVSALTIRLNGMSGWILWVTIRLFENMGVIREGLRSLSAVHEVTDAPGAKPLEVARAEVRIEGLRHHYGNTSGGVNGIDLHIPAGQRVGIAGPSGAGKSTLINLLLRFRDPEGGRILIDGQDIRGVTQESLRSRIGVVTQNTSLIHRSVRANIMYGNPGATEAEMIAAAKRAEAHEFIMGLRDHAGRTGYDAHVGERGVALSGGQRQRIAIARVVLKNAPVLILDEATSALDSAVEAAIQKTLLDVMQGKTVIAIAHRLSTIAQMDRIVVLQEGKIAEDGSHTELLARQGVYAGLWQRQAGTAERVAEMV
ncbi:MULTISPECIES: ABC transporter ATP-binding protein [unclassified Leisingera]|uniref:ABC transporter ATP-binding protein n=2 Tax=Leisingera TaxID=191028 RepID=UPI00030F5244|nr:MULTISPECIES: ABC transporter ATP-binding protein [unclassified Leisingera]KIC23786.1 multidrug ABC transporter ATP-binding protein [Leisingera sp. ANG-S3]KIC50692.1 multidrug ABC transporter ATP-binding protein [Leisingera sp. ANG-S]KID09925.1 multidrug ABC transporter ATP-binding protein [Leisingera sp. ANG1]